MGFSKKNIDPKKRNSITNGKVIVKYITKGGVDGKNGKNGTNGLNATLSVPSSIFKSKNGTALGNQTATTYVQAYNGTVKMDASIGAVSGAVTGITTTLVNNGEKNAGVQVNVSNSLVTQKGTLTIPVVFNTYDPRDASGNKDASYWDGSVYPLTSMDLKYNWELLDIPTSDTSLYYLDLSNQVASINCDASGKVLPGAMMPTCVAELTLNYESVADASYGLVLKDNLRGVSIDNSLGKGILKFDASTLAWDTTSTVIQVDGYRNNEVKDSAFMTLLKSIPGKNGEDAVSYWLNVSASKIKVDTNNSELITPNSITVSGWKQVGANAATSANDCSIFYGYETTTPSTPYTTTITNIDKSKEYIYFTLKKDNVIRDRELVPILWEGRDGSNGEDAYVLDLTNENMSINCDASGNILPSAYIPSSVAKLYYGGNHITSGVVFSITNTSTTIPSGSITINSSTGQITINNTLSFSTTELSVTISATYNGKTFTKVMNISKAIAGAKGDDGSNGQDAISYWLEMTANEVYVDVNNNNACDPSIVYIKAWRQVGENNPEQLTTSSFVKYAADASYGDTSCNGSITPASFVPEHKYVTVTLRVNNVVRDNETIQLLRSGKDGSKGDKGDQGLKGAVVRGPVKWVDSSTANARRFSNGVYNINYPQDASFIDVVLNTNDGSIYVCTTSFTGNASQTWSNVRGYFTASTQYDFVATDLLLAKNAKINFLSSNELYLLDSSNNITAGAKGSDSSSDINFWAGSSVPASAPFQVNNAGEITAKSGTFAGYVQYPYTFIAQLNHSGSYYDGYYIADNRANLIADGYSGSYGMGEGGVLLLPEPDASHNGFTYNIIAISNIATKSSENTSISLVTSDSRQCMDSPFKVFTFFGTSNNSYSMVKFYGGKISATCMPYRINSSTVGYYWAITEATGGVDCYGVDQFEWTGAGGGGYWHFNSGDQITARISNPPLNYSYWGNRYFRTSSNSTTLRVTVSGNTVSSSNKFYLCLDTESTSSAVLTFSGTTTRTYTVTLADNRSHSFNMFYSKTYSTTSDYVNVLFEVTATSNTLEYSHSVAPVCGYSENSVNNAVVYIVAENNVSSLTDKQSNTLYVSRN